MTVKRPEQWAYTKMLHGRHINTLHLVSMFKRQHEADKRKLIEDMCKLTGKVAIHGRLLTKRQRLKYGANRLQDGRTIYYVFERDLCPADVGVMVDLRASALHI